MLSYLISSYLGFSWLSRLTSIFSLRSRPSDRSGQVLENCDLAAHKIGKGTDANFGLTALNLGLAVAWRSDVNGAPALQTSPFLIYFIALFKRSDEVIKVGG